LIGDLYRYLGSSATIDLINADYTDTHKWLDLGPPSFDTSVASPRTKLVSLQNNDVVFISQASPTQPQANGKRRRHLSLQSAPPTPARRQRT